VIDVENSSVRIWLSVTVTEVWRVNAVLDSGFSFGIFFVIFYSCCSRRTLIYSSAVFTAYTGEVFATAALTTDRALFVLPGWWIPVVFWFCTTGFILISAVVVPLL